MIRESVIQSIEAWAKDHRTRNDLPVESPLVFESLLRYYPEEIEALRERNITITKGDS